MRPGGMPGNGEGAPFIQDTGQSPTAGFMGFPTAGTGTCGDYSEQIVLFSALAR